ncbi:MAG: hypothetical protein GVY27_04620 [Deinococcus-Thermus bacterium]|nr:hypothetical protein [Deinococcota bacterium]
MFATPMGKAATLALAAATLLASSRAADAALWHRPAVQERAAAAEARTAREVVESLQAALLEAMRGGAELGYAGRLTVIAPAAERAHSAEALARLVLHSNWQALTEDQRSRFVDALSRLTTSAYAARFDSYDGQRFEVVQEREVRDGVALVRTRLHKADGGTVSLDYLLRRFESGWRIVNIIADGVSEVSVKRAEYDAIIAREGFDALLADIERQIADYEAGRGDEDPREVREQPAQSKGLASHGQAQHQDELDPGRGGHAPRQAGHPQARPERPEEQALERQERHRHGDGRAHPSADVPGARQQLVQAQRHDRDADGRGGGDGQPQALGVEAPVDQREPVEHHPHRRLGQRREQQARRRRQRRDHAKAARQRRTEGVRIPRRQAREARVPGQRGADREQPDRERKEQVGVEPGGLAAGRQLVQHPGRDDVDELAAAGGDRERRHQQQHARQRRMPREAHARPQAAANQRGQLHEELDRPARRERDRQRQRRAGVEQHPADRDEVQRDRRPGRGQEALLGVQDPHRPGRQADRPQEREHGLEEPDREVAVDAALAAQQQVDDPRGRRDRGEQQEAVREDQQRQQRARQAPPRGVVLAGVDGHEAVGQRPFREQFAEQVGHPQRHRERVGHGAVEQLVQQRGAQQAGDPASEGPAHQHRGASTGRAIGLAAPHPPQPAQASPPSCGAIGLRGAARGGHAGARPFA